MSAPARGEMLMPDFTPLQNDRDYSLDWLTKFHNELATQLPGAPISSTPTAWMYGAAFGSQDSVYCKLHAAVGDKISWYQLQLYNGQKGAWNTCEVRYGGRRQLDCACAS